MPSALNLSNEVAGIHKLVLQSVYHYRNWFVLMGTSTSMKVIYIYYTNVTVQNKRYYNLAYI